MQPSTPTPQKDEGLDGLGILNFGDPEYFKKLVNELKSAIGSLSQGATQINATFGQTRERIVEIQTAIADATPGITRLGGDVNQTIGTIDKAAIAARRNVLITTEQTEKLFAASQILQTTTDGLVDAFMDVGVGIQSIPKQLESSLEYIRSIGGNSRQIFSAVKDNMEQLNRYQFEGGVQGLTKMAAQATMLRFDMSNTFRLAEKVLSPEGAIETAAAFQRLGVAAGNLVDPFQLMNQSINDPSGLQDSLANVSKQFTYFDDKTKTFKINPQGVMILREMEQAGNLAQGSLSKMGLAAAEADQRISAIKSIGLNLTEEDNQLLANISRMGDGGEFEVKVKNAEGKEYYEKISKISQEQLEATLKDQKEGPKTLEDLQRAQLTTTDIIKADLNAIKDKVVYGVVSPQTLLEGLEGGRRVVSTATGEFSKSFKTEDVRGLTENMFKSFGDLLKDFQSGKGTGESFANFLDKFQGMMDKTENNVLSGLKQTGVNISDKLTDKTAGESFIKKLISDYSNQQGSMDLNSKTDKSKALEIQSMLTGKEGVQKQLDAAGVKGDMKMSWNGPNPKMEINITNSNPNGTPFTPQQMEELTKVLTKTFNGVDFDLKLASANKGTDPTKAPVNTRYGK